MSSKTVVAIHQPNFFPWLGYFNKLARADVFILMDNVQFPKTGGTWINRVQILINGKPSWITLPIVRAYHGTRLIYEMKIDNNIPWRVKLLKTIQSNYGRAPYFSPTYQMISAWVNMQTDSLLEFNVAVIKDLMQKLGLDVSKLLLGSSLTVKGNATQLLVDMTKAVGGSAYLFGGGARGYQDDELFFRERVELIDQNFEHPPYSQFNAQNFIPGLSIIDVLMNCGIQGSCSLLGIGEKVEHQA